MTAKLAIDQGADVNLKNSLGRAPLHLACQADQARMVQANLQIRITVGESTLKHFAKNSGTGGSHCPIQGWKKAKKVQLGRSHFLERQTSKLLNYVDQEYEKNTI